MKIVTGTIYKVEPDVGFDSRLDYRAMAELEMTIISILRWVL